MHQWGSVFPTALHSTGDATLAFRFGGLSSVASWLQGGRVTPRAQVLQLLSLHFYALSLFLLTCLPGGFPLPT